MSAPVTAEEVRREAIERLIALAGDEPYDPDIIAARSGSRDMLRRRILDRRRGDLVALAELDRIWPLCRGDAVALIDTALAGGLGPSVALDPDRDPDDLPTVADLEAALAAAFTGDA